MYKLLLSALVFFLQSVSFAAVNCEHFQKFLDAGVAREPLQLALGFFAAQAEKHQFKSDYILLADYSLNSSQKRFFILNMQTGEVIRERVSHGSGKLTLYREASSPEEMMYVERHNGEKAHDGMFHQCKIPAVELERINKNREAFGRPAYHPRTNIARPGFFKTAELYTSVKNEKKNKPKGRHHWFYLRGDYNGMRLDGLSPGVNDEARKHGIVMHEATYNIAGAKVMGRSYGCPAFEKSVFKKHLDRIIEGRLYYSYIPQCADDHELIKAQVPNYENICSD